MKKIALLLAVIFVIGAVTGTITAFAKEKGSASTGNGETVIAGGGTNTGGSASEGQTSKPSTGGSGTTTTPTAKDPTFGSVITNESLRQSIDFSKPFTRNSDDGKWALYTDPGFTVLQSAGALYVKNTEYSYLGSDGVDTKCDFVFRMSKDYKRNDSHFSASFDLLGSMSGTLCSSVFISLEDEAGSYQSANLFKIRNEHLYAVDKTKGEVQIADITYASALHISYHVDMLKHTVQIWVGTKYVGSFTLDTTRVNDTTANQYFAYYAGPNQENVGRAITLDNIKVYY